MCSEEFHLNQWLPTRVSRTLGGISGHARGYVGKLWSSSSNDEQKINNKKKEEEEERNLYLNKKKISTYCCQQRSWNSLLKAFDKHHPMNLHFHFCIINSIRIESLQMNTRGTCRREALELVWQRCRGHKRRLGTTNLNVWNVNEVKCAACQWLEFLVLCYTALFSSLSYANGNCLSD